MKQVRNTTLGRLVQSFAGKVRAEKAAHPVQRPQELDTRVLTQVGGGQNPPSQLPNKNW